MNFLCLILILLMHKNFLFGLLCILCCFEFFFGMIYLNDSWNSLNDDLIVDHAFFLSGKVWNYFDLIDENLYFAEILNSMVDDSRFDLCYFLCHLLFLHRSFLNYFSCYFNLFYFYLFII